MKSITVLRLCGGVCSLGLIVNFFVNRVEPSIVGALLIGGMIWLLGDAICDALK